MRLLVDGRVFTHREITGVERYARHITAALQACGSDVRIVQPPFHSRVMQQAWEHTLLPFHAAHESLLFCPANMAPAWKPPRCGLVVTVHDLSFRYFKDSFTWQYRAYYEAMTRRIMRLADRIITVSCHERDRIAAAFPAAADKLRVVYNGVSAEFAPAKTSASPQNPYMLCVGSLNPRKNLTAICSAFLQIQERIPHRLVIAGSKQAIYRSVSLPDNPRIEFAGYCDDAALINLYQQAAAFVFPSLYEGFGLPVLEAMACGCPVITSKTSSLGEIAGDAALLVDPGNEEDIAHAMVRMLTDSALRETYVCRGSMHARMFTWERAARETMNVLEEVRL